MINVTKTYLPSKRKFNQLINKAWQTGHITNHGPLVLELEQKLKKYFGVKHLFLVNNGTMAIQIALKASGLKDCEVITTPFTYVATTSAIVWEGLTPVFADIEPETLTINPKLIESKITNKTKAIVAVHVYGIPCHIEAIEAIAKKHNLKVIYDAAHTFGAKLKNKSLMSFGDVSTISFQATKLFHTIDGGAISTNDDQVAENISLMRNFGHTSPETFGGVGINGKMNEFSAAMGLAILDEVPKLITKRRRISAIYDKLLKNNTKVSCPKPTNPDSHNYSYYPIIFDSEVHLLKAIKKLNVNTINPRRYFFPSLNTLPYVKYSSCPVSESISARVLCLPLFDSLKINQVKEISNIINSL